MIFDENGFPKILIVDDKLQNIAILVNMLEHLKINIFIANGGEEAKQKIDLQDFDLVLLDIIMPEVDGYNVCQYIKSSKRTKDTAVLFISSLASIEDKIKGFSFGADDYITKPFVNEELLARVKLHLHKRVLLKNLKELLRKSYHELYNPLAVINTSLEMHTIKYGTNRYVDAIGVASKTLKVLYDDLYYSLSSKNKEEKIVSINLIRFIESRIEFFLSLANEKKITIEFISDIGQIIQMRETDLLRIVDNTLSNAIKYGRTQTKVYIEVLSNDENVLFICKNEGSMIKNTEKIFWHKYRESYTEIGMGIGLEIVASLCQYYHIVPEVTSQNFMTEFKYDIPKIFRGKNENHIA